MADEFKTELFQLYRTSLVDAQLTTSGQNSLICPLCWKETSYEELSIEHVIPGDVGGHREILTCRPCNNNHGSKFDAHLVQYQAVADAFKGHGKLSTVLSEDENGRRMAADLEWGDGKKNFTIIAKATDPAAIITSQADFKSGTVSELNFSIKFGYSIQGFETAVLRAGYLVLFKRYGYQLIKHEELQIFRRRICDPNLEFPKLNTLIILLKGFSPDLDKPHCLVLGNINGIELLLVVIRLQKKTTQYLGIFLPVPAENSDEFFGLMEKFKSEHNGGELTLPKNSILW